MYNRSGNVSISHVTYVYKMKYTGDTLIVSLSDTIEKVSILLVVSTVLPKTID